MPYALKFNLKTVFRMKQNQKFTIPNQLTLLRIFLTPLFIILFLKKNPYDQLIATIVFVMASVTDWYDGWYARKFGVVSRWGQFMDPLADKILVSSALIIFVILDYVYAWMVWVIIIRDFLVTGLRMYALYIGKPIITHILAKWKTMLQMVTVFLILAFINWRNLYSDNLESYHPRYFDIIGIPMVIVTLLTVISGIIYLFENREVVLNILKKLFRI